MSSSSVASQNADQPKGSQSAIKMKHHGTPIGSAAMMQADNNMDLTSDRFRKATLSPPQSIKGGAADNMSAKGSNNGSASVTKQGHKVLASSLSKTKKMSYIKQLVKKS